MNTTTELEKSTPTPDLQQLKTKRSAHQEREESQTSHQADSNCYYR